MEISDLREKMISKETLYAGKVVHLERLTVQLPDGKQAYREVVEHVGAAAVVALDEQGQVFFVRQHRVAIDEMTWEIPAGKLNFKGEDPLMCAQRELEEETGLNAQNWKLLTAIVTTPGFCSERISIYLATGLTKHQMHTDEDEFLTCTKIPFEDALARTVRGEINDSKTVVGLLLAQQALSLYQTPFCVEVPSIQRANSAQCSQMQE